MYEARQNKEKVSRRISSTVQKSNQQFVLKDKRATIQKYQLGTGNTRWTTIQGSNNKSCTFEECLYNYVEYNKGDRRQYGTGTQNPAAWNGWIKNQANRNNASQLHVINRRWGGLGDRNGHNIVPGSPTMNSHHLHQAEVFFDDHCFGGSGGQTALHNCRYECWATPSYPNNIDVTDTDLLYNDPDIFVRITDSDLGTIQDYSPINGDGLRICDCG